MVSICAYYYVYSAASFAIDKGHRGRRGLLLAYTKVWGTINPCRATNDAAARYGIRTLVINT